MADSEISKEEILYRAEIDRSLRNPVMFFFTSGAVWLAVSLLLGFISSYKLHHPEFLAGCAWLVYGKVFAVHQTTLIYGWGCQAAFGAIIWLLARLNHQKCRNSGVILTGGHLWNLVLLLGVLGIFADGGTGRPWMEMPAFTWIPLLLSYLIIMLGPLSQFRFRPQGKTHVAHWYLMAAVLWFPWILGSTALLTFGFHGSPLGAAGANAWYRSALILLFFAPVAIGSCYFLTPKVMGKPIYNYGLALLGFWILAIIAPWAGLEKLMGVPVPYFLPYFGAIAAILFMIPAFIAGISLLKTAFADVDHANASPTMRFVVWAMIFLMMYSLVLAFLSLPIINAGTQFTVSGYGADLLALYGFFSAAAFAGIYFIVPRITRREWVSTRFIKYHFYPSIYGGMGIFVIAIFSGLMEGEAQEAIGGEWQSVVGIVTSFAVFTSLILFILMLSNLAFVLHLLLMWLGLGRRSGQPTLLAEHESASPHGDDGIIDVSGPMVQ